jgi:transposase
VSTNAVMDTNTSRRRRNRSWPEALKREIVAASLVPGVSVSIVARQYDVNANQVFKWRKSFGNGPRPPVAPQMIPVVVKAERTVVAAQPSIVGEKVEIDVAGKYRIRVSGHFDGEVLRRVLDVLERR